MGFAPSSIAVVLGTRPEIVKLGHLIGLLGDSAAILHTGQHYDSTLSAAFFEAFGLPEPYAVLGIGGESRGRQMGRVTAEVDALLRDLRPRAVVVQGDTNSAAGGAIAANATETPLVHVESGLRSFDRRMPEEHNRVIADHLADLCLAPTENNRANLLAEGIPDERIVVTGNTVVEALHSLLPDPSTRHELLARYGVDPNGFVLSTFHRPENVDDPATLRAVLEQLAGLEAPVVLPLHPRTRDRLDDAPVPIAERLTIVDPVGYPEFLGLAAESAMLISDSGGVQEEASVLKRPVLVVRRSTERPEVLGTFAVRVDPGPAIGEQASAWLKDIDAVHERLAGIPSPYGDGTASERSLAAIRTLVDG